MKYYAKLRADTVVEIVVVADEDAPDEQTGADYLAALTGWPTWKATPRPDGSTAWITGTYDPTADTFPPVPPTPPFVPEPESPTEPDGA
jgi:hypothetical protein